jgi:hypothetical protein
VRVVIADEEIADLVGAPGCRVADDPDNIGPFAALTPPVVEECGDGTVEALVGRSKRSGHEMVHVSPRGRVREEGGIRSFLASSEEKTPTRDRMELVRRDQDGGTRGLREVVRREDESQFVATSGDVAEQAERGTR